MGRGREMINKRPIICSVTELKENSYMPAFHYIESTQGFFFFFLENWKNWKTDVQIAVMLSLWQNKKSQNI